jgi:hypothetical protein
MTPLLTEGLQVQLGPRHQKKTAKKSVALQIPTREIQLHISLVGNVATWAFLPRQSSIEHWHDF